jgi:hypothetical protein
MKPRKSCCGFRGDEKVIVRAPEPRLSIEETRKRFGSERSIVALPTRSALLLWTGGRGDAVFGVSLREALKKRAAPTNNAAARATTTILKSDFLDTIGTVYHF